MAELRIDPKNILGKMKPVHYVNNGPVTLNFPGRQPLFPRVGAYYLAPARHQYPFGSGDC